jgi:hypothetical protein
MLTLSLDMRIEGSRQLLCIVGESCPLVQP